MSPNRRKKYQPMFENYPNREAGSAILFVVVLAFICSLVVGSVSFTSRYSLRRSGIRRERVAALNMAEAGKERFYARLSDTSFHLSPNTDIFYPDEPLGKGFYSLRCSTWADPNFMTIWSNGREGSNVVRLEITSHRDVGFLLGGLAGRVRGAVTARSNVDLTGNINIDGRNYDSLFNLVGAGTFGVFTCGTMDLDGNAAVGGNNIAPVDKKNINPVRSQVCRENAQVPPELAGPEALLGFAEGSLDCYDTTAEEFNPPFEGIVYVKENLGPVHFGNSSGILIVHNPNYTAKLHINKGTFRGLIICDVMDKSNGNATILGAVVTLSPNAASTFGNGNANILYSSQVLDNIIKYCKNFKIKVKELSWRELP